MYPVRLRLVRANGGLVDKMGCRSDVGWPRAVSEAVSAFLSGSIKPAAVKTAMPEKQEVAESTPAQKMERAPASE